MLAWFIKAWCDLLAKQAWQQQLLKFLAANAGQDEELALEGIARRTPLPTPQTPSCWGTTTSSAKKTLPKASIKVEPILDGHYENMAGYDVLHFSCPWWCRAIIACKVDEKSKHCNQPYFRNTQSRIA
jgi:hypothetical protein